MRVFQPGPFPHLPHPDLHNAKGTTSGTKGADRTGPSLTLLHASPGFNSVSVPSLEAAQSDMFILLESRLSFPSDVGVPDTDASSGFRNLRVALTGGSTQGGTSSAPDAVLGMLAEGRTCETAGASDTEITLECPLDVAEGDGGEISRRAVIIWALT
jgi:hypothetical protein